MPKEISRYLITTANERSWKFDRPVLFLGEWCRLYERQSVWTGMDALVAEPYGLNDGQKQRDIAYIQSLYWQLLKELTGALNDFHGTSHSLRYWNIVLGHWLQRYVTVIFNRYFTLEQVLDKYEVSGTTVLESAGYSLATTDSQAFVWACNDDIWNHVLYSKILNYWNKVEMDVDTECLRDDHGFGMEGDPRLIREESIKQLILNGVNKVQHKLSGKGDAFIIHSYLPLKEEIRLQLSLGQFPKLWRSPQLETVAPNPDQRQRLSLDARNSSGFERFVRARLRDMIPTCYLEGYERLVQQVESLPWPTKPRFIFTSNDFDTNELFKAWTGAKVEEGIPYFVGQHGNNYGTLIGSQNWPELTSPDKFFTWGWTNDEPKNVPAFIFKLAGRQPGRIRYEGGLLLIELHCPHRIGPEDKFFEYGIYQEDQFRFVEALPEAMRQQLIVRLHSGYRKTRWSDDQRWKDWAPSVKIETGTTPIRRLIAQSRLVVHSYDSTGVLDTLALNIPTLCFWHGGLDHLLPEAKPYYEMLRDANILADTPEQAAKFIASNWDDLSGWWESPRVQQARKRFCDQYARIEQRPVRTLKRLLTTHANQVSNK